MTETPHPAFAALLRRYTATDPKDAPLVALLVVDDASPQPTDDPRQVIQYLRALGRPVDSLADLCRAIDGLEDEEELSAHWCKEGLAVAHASDGMWFLFMEDSP